MTEKRFIPVNRTQLLLVTFIVITSHLQGLLAIKCYDCTYSQGQEELYDCVAGPINATLPSRDCPGACLVYQKIEVSTNAVYFLQRSCYNGGARGCDNDPTMQTCNHVCNDTDLCNDEHSETEPLPPGSTTTEAPGSFSCYICNYLYHPDLPPADNPCVNLSLSNATATVRCPPTHVCYIRKQWSKGYGVIWSFARSCIPDSADTTKCVSDTYYITYDTYCKEHLCNGGNGDVSCDNGGGGGGGGEGGGNDGFRNSSPAITMLAIMFILHRISV